MDKIEIQKIAQDWVKEKGHFSEPFEKIENLIVDDPKTAFRIIEEIHYLISSQPEIDYKLMGLLAAGHLETLLCDAGVEVIEEVERLAREDDEFRKCLRGVWKSDIPDEIYARVQKQWDNNFSFA
jgi:hypothetical protein